MSPASTNNPAYNINIIYLLVTADEQQASSNHKFQERSSCDPKAEGKDWLEDGVDHQQDDPIRDPLPV